MLGKVQFKMSWHRILYSHQLSLQINVREWCDHKIEIISADSNVLTLWSMGYFVKGKGVKFYMTWWSEWTFVDKCSNVNKFSNANMLCSDFYILSNYHFNLINVREWSNHKKAGVQLIVTGDWKYPIIIPEMETIYSFSAADSETIGMYKMISSFDKNLMYTG
jgi:hypothetical protein